MFPAFSAVCVLPLFLANIPTASLFSNVIVPVDVFLPFPVSEIKIPTPCCASISIVFAFSTFPLFWASIPKDFIPVAVAIILALLVAVDTFPLASFPSANIPIPDSAFKFIVPELVLFSMLEPSFANIPTDDLLFTLIFFSLIPVALLLANIPILSLFVALEFKSIVSVFTAFTLEIGIPVVSFVIIIPTVSLALTIILFWFVNVKVDELFVTDDLTSPNIPAEPSFAIVITEFVPSFFPAIVPPVALSNFTYTPADFLPLALIIFLLVALEFSTYIPADSSSCVVIELLFSRSPSLPSIPADFFFSAKIIPLFSANLLFPFE